MNKEHRTNRRYSAEFQIRVISDMGTDHLGYNETVYKYWDAKNAAGSGNRTCCIFRVFFRDQPK